MSIENFCDGNCEITTWLLNYVTKKPEHITTSSESGDECQSLTWCSGCYSNLQVKKMLVLINAATLSGVGNYFCNSYQWFPQSGIVG